MCDLLTEAKLILASNKSEKAARDFMTTELWVKARPLLNE